MVVIECKQPSRARTESSENNQQIREGETTMSTIHENITELVGNTPLVRIRKLNKGAA